MKKMTRVTLPSRVIRTERLILRPAEMTDAAAIAAGLGDFEVARWLARVPFPYDLEEAERFLNWEKAQRHFGEDRVFVIDQDGFIGLVSLRGRGEAPILGYWLARACWGRGLMSEAVGAVIAETFADGAISEIRSGVFDGNDRSLAIQLRFGFEILGRSRQHNLALQRDLDHIDTILTRARHAEFMS